MFKDTGCFREVTAVSVDEKCTAIQWRLLQQFSRHLDAFEQALLHVLTGWLRISARCMASIRGVERDERAPVFQIPDIQVVGFHLFDQGVTGVRTGFAQWPGGPLWMDSTSPRGRAPRRASRRGFAAGQPVAVTATSRLPRSAFLHCDHRIVAPTFQILLSCTNGMPNSSTCMASRSLNSLDSVARKCGCPLFRQALATIARESGRGMMRGYGRCLAIPQMVTKTAVVGVRSS